MSRRPNPLVPYPIVGTPWCAIDLRAGLVAIIDAEDAPKVANRCLLYYRPAKNNYGYVAALSYGSRREQKREKTFLHRLVMDAPTGVLVDHINRDGLDCRKLNLRLSDFALNAANQKTRNGTASGFKGVAAEGDKWRARIGSERRSLGTFSDPAEAARAYDRAAVEKWGEHARLNFPHEAARSAMLAAAPKVNP